MVGEITRLLVMGFNALLPILEGLILFGIVIFVHEGGHFFAAKLMGVKVLKFSLGWGPKLFGFKKGDTDYMVSWFPLGGYVKMAGDEPAEEINNELKAKGNFAKDEFLGQPWWSKIFIIFSGSFINLVFGVIVFFFIFWIGVEVGTYPTVIGTVKQGSAAEKAGFKKGDKILELDGKTVAMVHQFDEASYNKHKYTLKIERAGKQLSIPVVIDDKKENGKPEAVRPFYGFELFNPAVIEVNVGGAAYKAGLKNGDEILSANNVKIGQFTDIYDVVVNSGGKDIVFGIKRGNEKIFRTVTPAKDNLVMKRYVIGVSAKPTMFVKQSFTAKEACLMAISRPYYLTVLQVKALWYIAARKQSVKDSVGGPIMMLQMAGDAAEKGFTQWLFLAAILSTIVGALNLLLPLPVVDGGMMLIYLVEGIIRKPIPLKTQMVLMYAGWAVVIMMIVGIFSLDIFNTIIRTINK